MPSAKARNDGYYILFSYLVFFADYSPIINISLGYVKMLRLSHHHLNHPYLLHFIC